MPHTALRAACLFLLAACTTSRPLPPPDTAPAENRRIHTQLDAHTLQISQLQTQITALQQTVDRLRRNIRTAARDTATAEPADTARRPENPTAPEHGRRQETPPHNDGNLRRPENQDKLQNCESVIIESQNFAKRHPAHPEAAEALYRVGQCQWQMQQRDIARITWRQLIRHHPQSQAAIRAKQRLHPQPKNTVTDTFR